LQLATNLALLYVQYHVIIYEEAFFPNLETLVYVLPQSMHGMIETDFSGELEQRLCWKIPLGEVGKDGPEVLLPYRLAQEIAVLYAVLTGKDLLRIRGTTSEELIRLHVRLKAELENATPDTPAKLPQRMRRMMLGALNTQVLIGKDTELLIKQEFHAALLLCTIEAQASMANLNVTGAGVASNQGQGSTEIASTELKGRRSFIIIVDMLEKRTLCRRAPLFCLLW